MKIPTISIVMIASTLFAGSGEKSVSAGTSSSPAKEQTSTVSTTTPVAQAAMTAWQKGDKATAVSSFLSANWSARPLFASSSALSLSEDQFKALSDADRQAKSSEMMVQLDSFKQLAAAVAQAGRDAASKGDAAQARKYFASLKQCGTALDSRDCLSLVQLVGRSLKKRADTELAKLGP